MYDSVQDRLLNPLLGARLKGYPPTAAPRHCRDIAAAHWNVLAGDFSFPLAVLKREALAHNVQWMQARARDWGVGFAPHGKTTMSPQIFKWQLDAGAWGITFATVHQAAVGAAAGTRRAIIANQVLSEPDLAGIQQLLRDYAGLRIVFLVDSEAQLALIAQWFKRHPDAVPFEVMLEIGLDGARTGCRSQAQAVALACAIRRSACARLVGVECYEGQRGSNDSAADTAFINALMDRVDAVARAALDHDCFECNEILISAGGSSIYDLVSARLVPTLDKPVQGVLRSGCYVTHDHGVYKKLQSFVNGRLGCEAGESLRSALEVWTHVQSRPEPGLAIVAMGKRDVSYDRSLPIPIARAARGSATTSPIPASWHVSALNDQHGYLRWDASDEAQAPAVGEYIGFGISHPCTTFDKWSWMAVVENDYRVTDAVVTHF